MEDKLRQAYDLIKSVDDERAARLREVDKINRDDHYAEQRMLAMAWEFQHAYEGHVHQRSKREAA